jgi:hypothetical protein
MTQGSSCLATLGFGTESRWDSKAAFNPQHPPDIPRGMEMAKTFGLENLCRPACEYKSGCIPAKAGAHEGILR